MIQLSSPMLVSPRSWTVPRLKVQNSRIVLRWPMTNCVGSPAYFFSCGAAPRQANGKMRLSAPSVVRPSITQCAPTLQPGPITACGPITAYGPTLTVGFRLAPSATRAVGGMLLTAGGGFQLLSGSADRGMGAISSGAPARPAGHFVAPAGQSFELPAAAALAVYGDRQDQLVAGLGRAFETRAVDADE